MFQLDLKSRKSIYEQVVDNIKGLILSGVLNAEEKIPSVRELSKTLTVNPNTIQKAYRELERQGYLYTVSGLGTFVSSPEEIKADENKISETKGMILNGFKELFYLGLSAEEIHDISQELLVQLQNERSDFYDKG